MSSRIPDADPPDHGRRLDGVALAGLVAARICHDLVSPVGAIGNGVDLVREMGAGAGEDLEMIASSAGRAAALLKLHRLAFGPAGGGAAIARHELIARCAPVAGTRRVSLEAAGEAGPDLSPAVARLAALMLLAGRALLGLEGTVRLRLAPSGDLPLAVEAEGPRAAWPPALEALAFGDGGEATSRHVEFLLLLPAATEAGARLEPVSEPGLAGLRALPA